MNQEAAASLEISIRAAISGDAAALEDIVRLLQPGVYGVAIRMLWNREDAEDATQEILIRIVTRLAQFDFRSQLRTWAYRIAVNYLLDVKKSPTERLRLSFERFSEDLAEGLSSDGPSETERSVLVEEVKLGCTIALLQCLDRPHRAAYIVGEILELTGPEAHEVLEVSPELFRKRLQRARASIARFTMQYCGLVSSSAACQCHRRVSAAVQTGRVASDRFNFANEPQSFAEARAAIRLLEQARQPLAVHKSGTLSQSTVDFASRILKSIEDATRAE